MFTPRGVGARPLRRRRRGRLLGAVVLVAVLAAAGWYAWAWYDGRTVTDVQATRTRPSCPAPSPARVVVPAGEVKVNVYNATKRQGLAAQVAGRLERRGFRVGKVDNDPLDRKVTGPAEVRHSIAGADAARTVAVQVGDVVVVPDQRPGASVDLVLGAGFTQLVPAAEAEAALRPTPEPTPAGC